MSFREQITCQAFVLGALAATYALGYLVLHVWINSDQDQKVALVGLSGAVIAVLSSLASPLEYDVPE